ncbi:MAG: LysM peptidoglycan-binding domain-containing protein [Ferruginibacter sp.]|nr:LysM peptidoglycan-binding domain-containing protein [Ferruginibacter sp.]
MIKLVSSILLLLLLSINILHAQNISVEEYINKYKAAAITEMHRSGVPASITLSQGILETEHGNSDLVKKSNNHFGIKCKKEWTGESVRHTDDAPNECFRKYATAADSYKDHSEYLKNSPRYASLFELDKSDYKGWAYGLKRAGYATNPRYPQIVISNIEKYNLQQYDTTFVNVNEEIAVTNKVNDESILKNATLVSDNEEIKNALKANSKFNKLKALYASKGTSLLAIATAANIDLAKLLDYNDLKIDGLLKEDQLIYLERKNKQGNFDIYTTLQKETLFDIAQNFGIQLKSLLQLNTKNENEILPKGQKIKLR